MRSELETLRNRPMSLFGDWNRLQREMNRLFDEFTEETDDLRTMEWQAISPRCDLEETDSHFVVTADMPGIDKDQIKVEVSDRNVLTISGEKKEEKESNSNRRQICERFEGSFYRAIALPTDVDPQKVEAAYENGVLKIALPKLNATQTHAVKIGSGLGSFVSKFLHSKDARKEPQGNESQRVKVQ